MSTSLRYIAFLGVPAGSYMVFLSMNKNLGLLRLRPRTSSMSETPDTVFFKVAITFIVIGFIKFWLGNYKIIAFYG